MAVSSLNYGRQLWDGQGSTFANPSLARKLKGIAH
jgi:hypothetical protein